jgi:polyisoprenoid-binding protein YceI
MTYRSAAIAALPGGRWLVDGVLAVRGVSRPTPLVVDVGGAVLDSTGTPRVAFHASATLTRRDFGLTTELGKEAGTNSSARDVAIDIDVEAVNVAAD